MRAHAHACTHTHTHTHTYIYLASGITLEKFWEFQFPINPSYLKIFPL